MTSLPIEYAFCQNIHCSLHALFLAANPEANSELKVGDVCPICGVEKIASIFINAVTTLIGKPASGTDQGTVLKGLPYGGMVLQRGDDDATQTWGGAKVTDARHTDALYVAELQKDLVRLAYYGPGRGLQKVGQFNLQVMASVLNVKQHLAKYYGIPASENFKEVQDAAAAIPVTPTTPPAPTTSPGATTTTGSSGKLAIYYPKTAVITSPAEALGGVGAWSKHLGVPGGKVPLLDSIKSWAKTWEQLQTNGTPAESELPQIREQALEDQKLCTELTKRQSAETSAAKAFSGQVSRLQYPHQQGTLTDSDVTQGEQSLAALAAASEAAGSDIPNLLTRVRATDKRLPQPVAIPDPGNKNVTLVPQTLTSSATLEERYQRLVDANKRTSSVQAAQSAALNFARGKLSTFRGRADAVGTVWGKLAAKRTLILDAAELIRTKTEEAVTGAVALNGRPVTGKSSVSWQLGNARKCTQQWLSSTGNNPPQSAGSLEQIEVAVNDIEARWTTQGISPPNPEWLDMNSSLGEVRINIANFNTEITKKSAESWDSAYSDLLKDYGRVDLGTARHIRAMVTEGKLYGTNVFRTPQGSELIPMTDSVLNKVPDLMERMMPLVFPKRNSKDGPLPLIRFIFSHESGATHAYNFGGTTYVKVGVDWPNSEESNSWFSEKGTSTSKLSTSRGWGATQFTTFEKNKTLLLKDVDGSTNCYDFHAGIPFASSKPTDSIQPLLISSVEENVAVGTKRYLEGFAKPSRECSYKHKYKCSECAQNLYLGSSQTIGGGVHQFKDPKCDFVQIHGKGGSLYGFRDLEKLRTLVQNNDFKLASGRNSEQATEEDLIEFPCSWLAAVMRYSGVNQRGYYYMLEALEALKDPTKAKTLDP